MTQYEYILELQKEFKDIKDICFWGVVGTNMENVEKLCEHCQRNKYCTGSGCREEIERVIKEHRQPETRQPTLWEIIE